MKNEKKQLVALKKTGWYLSESVFLSMWGIWDCRMDYMGDDKDHRPGGAWWHNEGELVDADVRY